jgi:hypothetical protein
MLKVEVSAEYCASRYDTVLQDHMLTNILQNSSEIPLK